MRKEVIDCWNKYKRHDNEIFRSVEFKSKYSFVCKRCMNLVIINPLDNEHMFDEELKKEEKN